MRDKFVVNQINGRRFGPYSQEDAKLLCDELNEYTNTKAGRSLNVFWIGPRIPGDPE